MAKKETLTLEELLTLCDFDGKLYIQKKGADYLDALSRLFSLNNRNDIPFTLDDIKVRLCPRKLPWRQASTM